MLDKDRKPGTHPFHAAGLYYLQDPAAMAAAVLLDPRPGEWVLDLCAAPGGKAAHLAARMQNTGVLIANEVDPRRASVLAMNLERLGVTNAMVLNETPGNLVHRWANCFDRVLVDAPCSGETLWVGGAAAVRGWSPNLVKRFARRQLKILKEAADLTKPGGLLLYATCSFSPEENEGVVSRFLSCRADFEVVELPGYDGFAYGHPEWIEGGHTCLAKAVRLWPHRAPGRGHFYALLRRKGERIPERSWETESLNPPSWYLYEEFCRHNLKDFPARERLWEKGGQIFQVPISPNACRGLKVLRPGWWLGNLRKGRFEPDHALAMGLKAEQALRVWNLPVESRELRSYLRGETLAGPWEQGWVLVAVEGFPVGWAWAERGRLKSLYPRHLRAPWW